MRSIYLAAGAAGILGLFAACGGDEKPKALPDAPAGGTGGKRPTMPDAGGEGGDGLGGTFSTGGSAGKPNGGSGGGIVNGDGPVVVITAPEESPDIDGEILVDDVVTVLCTVEKSSSPRAVAVDPASVRIELQDSEGTLLSDQHAKGTKTPGEYSAQFPLVSVPAGKVSFSCSASDQNANASTTTISTFVDHGPEITVSTPEPSSAHPLDDLDVRFFLEPNPLRDDDPGADIGDVVFTFDGKDFEVTEDAPGEYSTKLPLYDINLFPETPQGAITITAANKRKPKAAVAVQTYSILVDGIGPTISITSPLPQAVVGGTVTLSFKVIDPGSGVDPNSVYVKLFSQDAPRFFDPKRGWARNGDNFTYAFDSKLIEPNAPVQTTINVQANDAVGNRSASGQSVQIYLDNVPPKLDLDPRPLRALQTNGCSGAYDPVGSAVPNDLAGSNDGGITAFEWFRVLVQERTNSVPGQDILYPSGTQQSEVRLYVQSRPEQAATKLLVNKNPGVDDTCDDIGGVDSLVNPPLFTALRGLDRNGQPPNIDDIGVTAPTFPQCANTNTGANPAGLCNGSSDLAFVPYNEQIKEPYIYVVGEPKTDDVSCTGIDFAFLTTTEPDGWVCLAARGIDRAGNVGISPPLRVCVDDPLKPGSPPCATMSTTPPTCTDGCTPPERGGGFLHKMN